MAVFHGDGIQVPVIGSIGHFSRRNTDDHLAFQSDDIIHAGPGSMAFCQSLIIISSLLRGHAGLGRIMNDNTRQFMCRNTGPGIGIDRQIILFHQFRKILRDRTAEALLYYDDGLQDQKDHKCKHRDQAHSKDQTIPERTLFAARKEFSASCLFVLLLRPASCCSIRLCFSFGHTDLPFRCTALLLPSHESRSSSGACALSPAVFTDSLLSAVIFTDRNGSPSGGLFFYADCLFRLLHRLCRSCLCRLSDRLLYRCGRISPVKYQITVIDLFLFKSVVIRH